MSGLWRACHQAVLPFNRSYRGGILAGQAGQGGHISPRASEVRADCVSILGAETCLAPRYSSGPF